jgi:hypothetical protein
MKNNLAPPPSPLEEPYPVSSSLVAAAAAAVVKEEDEGEVVVGATNDRDAKYYHPRHVISVLHYSLLNMPQAVLPVVVVVACYHRLYNH